MVRGWVEWAAQSKPSSFRLSLTTAVKMQPCSYECGRTQPFPLPVSFYNLIFPFKWSWKHPGGIRSLLQWLFFWFTVPEFYPVRWGVCPKNIVRKRGLHGIQVFSYLHDCDEESSVSVQYFVSGLRVPLHLCCTGRSVCSGSTISTKLKRASGADGRMIRVQPGVEASSLLPDQWRLWIESCLLWILMVVIIRKWMFFTF